MTEKEGCISFRRDGEVGLLLGRLLVGELLGIESQEKTDSWPTHTGSYIVPIVAIVTL